MLLQVFTDVQFEVFHNQIRTLLNLGLRLKILSGQSKVSPSSAGLLQGSHCNQSMCHHFVNLAAPDPADQSSHVLICHVPIKNTCKETSVAPIAGSGSDQINAIRYFFLHETCMFCSCSSSTHHMLLCTTNGYMCNQSMQF